jgi:acid phosphatase (class A)
MKKLSILVLFLFGVAFTLSAQEDYHEATPYFTPEQMPDMKKYLPGPPAEDSEAFKYDLAVYELGKKIRATDSKAAEAAKAQSDNRIANLCKQFSDAFGMEISMEKTPQIYTLLRDGVITCVKSIVGPKEYYHRTRPFAYHKEGTLMPDAEGMLHQNGSFPSGHTLRGWTTALLLVEINPERAEQLLSLGYQYGQSRVISGYHWQSDIDASRLIASATVAKLHTSERFLRQMKRAKREYKKLSK